MVPQGWLRPTLVLTALEVASIEELAAVVAAAFGSAPELGGADVESALVEALRDEGFSIGSGVAVPHTELQSLKETLVGLATLTRPLQIRTIDSQAPDLFFFVLSKPDPEAHLLLLAHIARLSQSRTFREGIRRARTSDEVLALVRAAELRQLGLRGAGIGAVPHAVVLISISGEKAVDALLVDLVDQGYGHGVVLEAQSLEEAAAREVPLFASFRDLFGDPGGRRMLVVETPSERVGGIIEAVRRLCGEYCAGDARVSVIPVHTYWELPTPAGGGAGGH